jgi:hypothetical protein
MSKNEPSKEGCLFRFAVISFVVCTVIAGGVISYFVNEFGRALNPRHLFQSGYLLAFVGAVASFGAIVLPMGVTVVSMLVLLLRIHRRIEVIATRLAQLANRNEGPSNKPDAGDA